MERDPVDIVVNVDILALDSMMSYLNVKDLLSCRLVSDLWNRAASLELRERSTLIKTISNEGQLMQLEDCMKQSWNYPFAGLTFDCPRKLQSDGAMKFFKDYGLNFTSLSLDDLDRTGRLDDLAPFIYYLPRLSILELGEFPSHWRNRSFVKALGPAAGQAEDLLRLPSVRTIRMSTSKPEDFEEVLEQVLEAASPGIQVECLGITPGVLRVLESAGKLRALSDMKFDLIDGIRKRAEIDEFLEKMSPSVTKLYFHYAGHLSMYGLKKILFSSQHTLQELHLRETCLSHLAVYKRLAFNKLTTLSFDVELKFSGAYLFRGRHEGNFPVLKHLKLKTRYRNMEDLRAVFLDDLVFPSVTTIDLDGYVNDDGIKKLAEMFPNVIEIRLDSGYYSGQSMKCGRNPSEIWSVRAFKRLEKLVIWNFIVGRPAEPYINMDSFLTGIPFEECQKLSQNKIPFKESSRVTPSILQLENLKQLVVCVKLGNGHALPMERAPFISMVTVRYALEIMPKLQTKFLYEPAHHDEREIEVLETAFHHVHQHAPLEPFFY